MQEYMAMWKNFTNFSGRTSVRGYWMVMLFNIVISFVLGLLGGFLGLFTVIAYLYSLVAFIPGLALSIRRLHDINKSGYWLFIGLIPGVGAIILLVFSLKASVNGDNKYGMSQV